MKTKKGFTLIELLAVIVILAVIALIATPLVMSTINDAKEGALKSTVRAIKEEAEKLYVKKVQLNPSENPTVSEDEIEYSGDQIPTEDMKVTFNNSGLANIAIYKDSKCVYKLFNDSDVKVEKEWTKEQCLQSVLLGADLLVKKANGSTVTTYVADSEASKQMYTFSHTIGETTTTDYRYIGVAPDNYIEFNGETWRIIGVFGDNIKIIRDASIGNMPRDYKKGSSANPLGSSISEDGSNDWSDSQLMYMLNPTTYSLKQGYTLSGNYIKDINGNIIYETGKLPAAVEVGATTYGGTANSWKLSDEALALVETTTYNLGAIGWSDTSHFGGAESMYAAERGTALGNSASSTTWTGKVGLMYPSDYAYTFAYQSAEGTQICYTDTWSCRDEVWDNVTFTGTPTASWLYKSGQYQWTISPRAGDSDNSFLVYASGNVALHWSNNAYVGVRPVVYLRSDIVLTGSGVKDTDPYKIVG